MKSVTQFPVSQTCMQTVRGQCLDLITAPSGGKVDFRDFTEDRYNTIVKWKTSYYSFYLPVAIAMYMVGHLIVRMRDI